MKETYGRPARRQSNVLAARLHGVARDRLPGRRPRQQRAHLDRLHRHAPGLGHAAPTGRDRRRPPPGASDPPHHADHDGRTRPLAYGGRPLWEPIAWMVLRALVVEMFLTLLVIPTMYCLFAEKLGMRVPSSGRGPEPGTPPEGSPPGSPLGPTARLAIHDLGARAGVVKRTPARGDQDRGEDPGSRRDVNEAKADPEQGVEVHHVERPERTRGRPGPFPPTPPARGPGSARATTPRAPRRPPTAPPQRTRGPSPPRRRRDRSRPSAPPGRALAPVRGPPRSEGRSSPTPGARRGAGSRNDRAPAPPHRASRRARVGHSWTSMDG